MDLEALPLLSARDADDLSGLFPAGFTDLYEVHSYRNAARILATACEPELTELVEQLSTFRVETAQIVAPEVTNPRSRRLLTSGSGHLAGLKRGSKAIS
jgi:hypothetical protein